MNDPHPTRTELLEYIDLVLESTVVSTKFVRPGTNICMNSGEKLDWLQAEAGRLHAMLSKPCPTCGGRGRIPT